jgi:hypothetical protein
MMVAGMKEQDFAAVRPDWNEVRVFSSDPAGNHSRSLCRFLWLDALAGCPAKGDNSGQRHYELPCSHRSLLV